MSISKIKSTVTNKSCVFKKPTFHKNLAKLMKISDYLQLF